MQKPLLTLITIAILCVVAFRVVSVFITPEQTPADIEMAKKLAIAIEHDTPRVSIRGSVYLPDGSPAEYFHINTNDVAYQFSSSGSGCVHMRRHGFTGGIRDGAFSVSAQTGANVAIAIYPMVFTNRDNPQRQFVAKPIVVVPYENMESLTITLEEGIPVRGKLMYDNGTPASERGLTFEQQFEPILGADIQEMRDSLRMSRSASSNENGEYEIFLLPGEYTVFHRGFGGQPRKETLTIARTDTEKQLDWTLPTPIFVETFTEVELTNTSPRNTSYVLAEEGRGAHSFSGARLDSFVLEPVTADSTLFIADLDNKVGTIETITPAMTGETVRFELKPMATITVTLVDGNGNPLVGKRVSHFIRTTFHNSMNIGRGVETNEEGKAVLPVLSGKHSIGVQLPGTFQRSHPTDRSFRSVIEKELDLAPGENFYLGTITLRNVVADSWQGFNAPAVVCCP